MVIDGIHSCINRYLFRGTSLKRELWNFRFADQFKLIAEADQDHLALMIRDFQNRLHIETESMVIGGLDIGSLRKLKAMVDKRITEIEAQGDLFNETPLRR